MTDDPSLEYQLIGHASSDGGPFLLVDARAAAAWRGTETEATDAMSDYDRACAAIPEVVGATAQMSVGGLAAIVWDFGPGTVDIWRHEDVLLLCDWAEMPNGSRQAFTPIAPTAEPVGAVEVHGRWLVLVWATEDLHLIGEQELRDGQRIGWAVNGSGIVAEVAPGTYECFAWMQVHDRIPERRLYLRLVASLDR